MKKFLIILLFFISRISFADNCENNVITQSEITKSICSTGDIFVKSNPVINSEIQIEVPGNILGNVFLNHSSILLKTNNPNNIEKFSNPKLVKILPLNTSYQKFTHALKSTIIYSTGFIGLVLLIFIILYKIEYFKPKLIIKEPLSKKQILRELVMGTICVSLTFFVIFYNESFISLMPFNKLMYSWTDSSILYHITSFFLLMIIYDTFFFWLHYLFHRSIFLYKTIHFVHHLSINPNPLTALNFNPIEMIGNYAILIFCSMLLPVHIKVFQFFFIFHTLFDIYKHCGHQLIPLKYDRWMSEWFLIGPNYHEIHHTQAKYHLGFFFPYWDKLTNSYQKKWEKPL